jgi:hypothetical protein
MLEVAVAEATLPAVLQVEQVEAEMAMALAFQEQQELLTLVAVVEAEMAVTAQQVVLAL